jgi:hypothetical protein
MVRVLRKRGSNCFVRLSKSFGAVLATRVKNYQKNNLASANKT